VADLKPVASTLPTSSPESANDLLSVHGLDRDARASLQIQAEALSQRLRLPLRSARGGMTGQWLGASIGASLEFQDHRQYQPGDDPRYLNWAAYARTGQYTMKMFREEVSPRLDVVLDCSPSMFLTHSKAARTLELLAFTVACAARAGALLRVYQANSETAEELPLDSLRGQSWQPLPKTNRPGAPMLGRVLWRAQSLRIVISDLLYAVPPEGVLASLLHTPGRAILFSPWSRVEAEPDWDGQIDLLECESGERRVFHVLPSRLERYRGNYRRHFALWDEACRARNVALARVGDEGALQDRLMESAVPSGAVELAQT